MKKKMAKKSGRDEKACQCFTNLNEIQSVACGDSFNVNWTSMY